MTSNLKCYGSLLPLKADDPLRRVFCRRSWLRDEPSRPTVGGVRVASLRPRSRSRALEETTSATPTGSTRLVKGAPDV